MTELEVADCFQVESEKQLTHEEIGFIYVCDSYMDVLFTGFKKKSWYICPSGRSDETLQLQNNF